MPAFTAGIAFFEVPKLLFVAGAAASSTRNACG